MASRGRLEVVRGSVGGHAENEPGGALDFLATPFFHLLALPSGGFSLFTFRSQSPKIQMLGVLTCNFPHSLGQFKTCTFRPCILNFRGNLLVFNS